MTEIALRNFLDSGKVSDALKILQECHENKNSHIGVELGKFFRTIFPSYPDLLLQIAYCAYDIKNYQLCYDTITTVKSMNLPAECLQTLSYNESMCIPEIADNYIHYCPEIVQKILNRPENAFPMITFTITTCKRYDLFEKTINSFLNCCTDLHKIDKWLCVDDNSSEEDRKKMQEKYPFFQFYFKSFAEKGHPQSMNIIKNTVKTPYIFHMEDDWKFICRKNYISKCIDVISQSDKIGQCLINKNYSETEKDFAIVGGILRYTNSGTRYYLHEHCATEKEYENFNKTYGVGPNCAYWKHFSFRPSLLKRHILEELGPYDEKISHFEQEYSDRYYRAGYVSTFLDGIYSLHIGRLTSERFDESKQNAYILNGEKQFSGKEEIVSKNAVKLNMKTYILNLDRRNDRWEAFSKHEDPKCLAYQRFSAIDGSKLSPNKQLQRIFEGNDYNMREGMVGCALSHIKMWIELVNSQYDFFCILEDDLEFVPNFREKFLHLYSNLPKDWHICFLGHHLWKKFKTADNFDKEALPTLCKKSARDSLEFSMGGTGGYLISKQGARGMLEIINQIGMTNGIDTMMQKSADILNVYYCTPHLIYSECWDPETDADTDIQKNYRSLNLEEKVDLTDYPERLKKNGIFNIDEALLIRNHRYLISCSETTHVCDGIKTFEEQKLEFPFDKTDRGKMEDFAEIITTVLNCDMENLLEFTVNFCMNNKYGIIFPHEKCSPQDLIAQYFIKFRNLKQAVLSNTPVVIVHVSRWRKTDPKVFQDLIDTLHKFNKNARIVTVNGLKNQVDEKYGKFIVKKQLDFPEKYHHDEWPDEKIYYDQRTFRYNLIPLMKSAIAELQF
jgi:GR25 family glycosyltransferase involved in LPS biosynthesis